MGELTVVHALVPTPVQEPPVVVSPLWMLRSMYFTKHYLSILMVYEEQTIKVLPFFDNIFCLLVAHIEFPCNKFKLD